MKLFFTHIILLTVISCNNNRQQLKTIPQNILTQPIAADKINYDSCKKAIVAIKQKHKNNWGKLSKTTKENIFVKAIAETIIPGWVGTKWDFNGTSEHPQQGYIACGYFVTTVLRDAGVNIARIKLAQCASEKMIQTLIQPKYIQRFSRVSIENFIASVKLQGYGLYIVGLDNHTGFIYNDGAEVYFIHSTFVGTKNVQYEKALLSQVLQQSNYKVIGKISGDENVLQQWIK